MGGAHFITESGWKAVAAKFKLKDNGLQKALANYERLQEDDYDGRVKALAGITQLAAGLPKSKEVAAAPTAAKWLAELVSAVAIQKSELLKAKAAAVKSAAQAQKQAGPAAKEAEDDDGGNKEYSACLLAALQKLKSAKDTSYEFIVCDAKPLALVVAKKITAQHKASLTELTGSKRFLPTGTCSFQEGKFIFNLEMSVSGLARRIQDSIKIHTGKKLPIAVGTEAVAADEAAADGAAAAKPPAKVPEAGPPPTLGKATLMKAPEVWHGTRDVVQKNLAALRQAVRQACVDEPPEFIDIANQNLQRLEDIPDHLDAKLAESLARAAAAKDQAARQAELQNSKRILAEYIAYVKSEPLIAHVDGNPFGVATNLKKVLVDSLTHMAQAIG